MQLVNSTTRSVIRTNGGPLWATVLDVSHASLRVPSNTRRRVLAFALRHETTAVDWALARGKLHKFPRRVVGRLALRLVDAHYRGEFRALLSGPEPILAATSFDPNHVVLVIGSLGPGGAERQVVTTLLGLKRTGTQRLTLICTFLQESWQKFFLPQLVAEGIEVCELAKGSGDMLDLEDTVRPRFDKAFASIPPKLADIRDYAAAFAKLRPGVVHLWLDEINCKAGLAALAIGIPQIVLSARSVSPHHFGHYQQYMAEAYRLLACNRRVIFLNNSEAGAADYAKWLGINRTLISVVHNGFHFEDLPDTAALAESRRVFRATCGWDGTSPVLGTIIRFTEEKRPDLWIEAALLLALQRPSMRFLLVGDGPLRIGLQERVTALGLMERFFFAGYQRDTIAALAAMDVFLLTSRKEGLPNVLVEAQALGLPVVSTDAGGSRETFLPNETGILVTRASAVSLAEAVMALIDDSASTVTWSSRASRQARDRFGIDRMIRETRATYGLDQKRIENSVINYSHQSL